MYGHFREIRLDTDWMKGYNMEELAAILFLVVACTIGAVLHSILYVVVNFVTSRFVKEQDD